MIKSKIAKIGAIAVGMTLALGAASSVGAQSSVADLQSQINALMAQLAALQGGGSMTGGQALSNFNTNLTIGSRGTDVSALQSYLVSNGHLVMPAGVPMGYFGSLTKAAVAKFQAANGISPAVGFFGPITRAKLNGMIVVAPGTPGGVVCPVGYTCTPPGGSTGVITTPGVEGSITVSVNPSPATGTKLYENEDMKPVLGIKLEAKTSDIKIERIKIDLDEVGGVNSDNDLYRKIATKIYVMDGSTVLGSMDLNASTVVEDGSDRFITIAGLNFIVPKNTTKVLTVALDANTSWDSDYNGDAWTLGVQLDGVRGVDGAGVNQYGPSTAFTREFNSAANLVDSATMTISTNSGTPQTQQVICTTGTDEDECDALELLKADFKAEKDAVTINDLRVDLTRTGSATGTTTTAYLYDGSTLVGSATVVDGGGTNSATFSDIEWTVPKDTTRTLSVRFDIRDVTAAATNFVADIDTADITDDENSDGGSVADSGSATGKTFTVRKVGPEVTLISKPITTSGVPESDTTNNLSTSTLTATFNVKVKAMGGALLIGNVASGTPVFASSTTSFKVYRNGSYDGTISAGATSTSYSIPSTCTTTGTNSCELAEGAEVTIPVTFSIIGRTVGGVALTRGSVYAIGLEGIQWIAKDVSASAQTTTFMAGENDWRTVDVSFP